LAQSHPPDIALGWGAKQASALAAELGCTLITHTAPGVARVEALVEHQLPRFLQTQLLLELQRAHACDGAEMLAKSRWTHVRASCQVVDVQHVSEILLEPGDGLRDLLARGPGGDQVLQLWSVATG